MADPRDDLPDGFDPEDPKYSSAADPEAGSELWRLLQEDGQIAGEAEGQHTEPAHPRPFPTQPEDHLAAEEMEQWQRYRAESTGAEDDARASRLRRMIETPEELADEGFEFDQTVRSGGRNGDFDPALREETRVIACRNHPDAVSVAQCPECQAFYCQACLVIRRGKMLCRDCAQTAFVLSEEEVLRAEEEGRDADVGVAAEVPPEFQLGSFGTEGAPASPIKKTLAWLFDFALTKGLLLLVVWVGALLDLSAIPEFARAVFATGAEGPMLGRALASITAHPLAWLPIMLLIDFVYFFLTFSFFNRSIGMSWVGCRIVTEWGEYVSFGAAAVRSIVYVLCLELPALLASFFFGNYRGPHDLAAGTIEINYSGVKRVDAYETIQLQL
jgi:uncharacterized RDD family membrane protein YckC